MSIFDEDILESESFEVRGKEYTVYEITAYDRVHNIPKPEASDDLYEIQRNQYLLTETILYLSVKPCYPEKSEEQIKKALAKLPSDVLNELFRKAAKLNHIPVSGADGTEEDDDSKN